MGSFGRLGKSQTIAAKVTTRAGGVWISNLDPKAPRVPPAPVCGVDRVKLQAVSTAASRSPREIPLTNKEYPSSQLFVRVCRNLARRSSVRHIAPVLRTYPRGAIIRAGIIRALCMLD